MNRFFLLVFILLVLAEVSIGQDYTLESPAKTNRIEVSVVERLTYKVLHKNETVLNPSAISITINDKKYGSEPKVRKSQTRSVNEVIKPVLKVKRAEVQNDYNELELQFAGKYGVIFRAYDDGIAYRITTNMKGEITIQDEEIEYNFGVDHTASIPVADGFFTHYERNYTTQKINALGDEEMSCLPILVHLQNGRKAVITESDLYDYPGFYLKKGTVTHSLSGTLPGYPKQYKQPDDRDVRPTEREEFLAKTNGKRSFPWRLMVISDEDKDLVENELVLKLSSPLKLKDTSWIRPGKVAWDWYNANNITGVDFESGINTDTYKYYIDFAAEHKLQYVILDEGWYDIKTNDLIHPVSTIDMEELARYGNEKQVGLILWVTWKALEDMLNPALDQFEKWGVKGIKVDFMQRDDQWMVSYYEKVARLGAEHKLLVDFHGSYKPSGLRRAYPNVITREGVKGLEQHKWEGQMANPEYDVEIPFIRMLAGPMDYTPGAMRNAQKRNYQAFFERPMSLGTRCHQLAMYVIYESPLQMLADSPSNYHKEQECMEFLSVVPTVWDETMVLDAKFGDYVLIARKSGKEWYVGALTDWSDRDLEVDLSFLGEGEYTIDLYQDGANAERHAEDFKRIKKKVTHQDKLKIHLASGGGWVARIY
ncbi:glycoside hydrolase family 97 protein [Fulvivirga sp. M361]|nr:glycoside hydrolase family 97 protein [Fulvivirga sp. M361]